jgi:hypothetical protein
LLQAALEAEVAEFLGRERYARGGRARAGHRNGHQPVTVKTTAGPVTLDRPKLRGTDQAFCSRLLGKHVTRTHALESLVIAGYVRGLSDRDVEASLAEALGSEATLSRSTVSRICEQVKAEFDAWTHRGLGAVELDYPFVDASHFRMHPGARAEPVLRAWGISSDGKPVFLALEAANAESHDACAGFLRGLVGRGLRPPLLVTCDGAPGLIGAIEQVFDRSLRQRCLVHRACVDSTWWFGIGRRVVLRGDGGEKVCRAVKPRRRWREAKAVLFKQRADLRQGVTDRPAADVEQVGEGLHSAHLPQVEDGGQDPFGVGDLLPEDAPAGAGEPCPAPPLVAASFHQGGVPDRQPVHEPVQVHAGHAGQGWVGQLLVPA